MNTKSKKLKSPLLALGIGLMLAFASLLYVHEGTVTINNDCKGNCAAWDSRDVRVVTRGYPQSIIVDTSPGGSLVSTEFKILGAIVDWSIYSSLAYILILVIYRRNK